MAEGRVTVNGVTVRELGSKADITCDDVRVDGVRLRAPERPVYIVLNKPRGAITTRHDPEGRATVMDLVPPVAGLFPVGRLDVTTEGLILLTNDGAFAEQISHPRYEVPRVYQAKVHGVPDEKTLERIRRGVRVEGDELRADRVRVIGADRNAWLEVTLHEGKKHEVRRLLEAVGHPVSKLRRVAFGPVTTKGLEPGQFRHLMPREVKALLDPRLRATAARPPEPPRSRRRPSSARPRPDGPSPDRPRSDRPVLDRPVSDRSRSARPPSGRSSPGHPPADRSRSGRPSLGRPPSRRRSTRPAKPRR